MSEDYEARKAHFDNLLTLYGRKPAIEALSAEDIEPVCLHLADSNRPTKEISLLIERTEARGGEVKYHSREALSRISRNRKQDQGVALDVSTATYQPFEAILDENIGTGGLLAVDGVTNPQNLGMIIRAVGASPRDGLILARAGNARIDPLVIKASAGTLFRTPIYHCEKLLPALESLKREGFAIFGLDGEGTIAMDALTPDGPHVFVLGNETQGLSDGVREICDDFLAIPMARGIESLNVAVAAGIVAFAR